MTPLSGSAPPYRIGVLSDTHGRLPARVFEIFAGVQLILHAGDVGRDEILTELEALVPVHAVSGNVDGPPDPRLRPYFQRLDTPLGRIGMTHGHLADAPSTSKARMIAKFHEFKPDIIVFGHSHIPLLVQEGGVTFFNPGSAGAPRFGHGASVGLITAATDSGQPEFKLVEL